MAARAVPAAVRRPVRHSTKAWRSHDNASCYPPCALLLPVYNAGTDCRYPDFIFISHVPRENKPAGPAMTEPRPKSRLRSRLHAAPLLKQLGPGIITGAADDDPSGIATYSQ